MKKLSPLEWVGLIVIVIILLALGRCTKGSGFFNCNKPDTISVKTITKIDTIKGDTVYVPRIDTIINTVGVFRPEFIHDTLEVEAPVQPTDTPAIIYRFYQKVFYQDRQLIGGSEITIFDTVSQNRIIGRRLTGSIPVKTIKETITLESPKRIILYFDISAMGNKNDLLYGTGGGFSLKGKNDVKYGAKVWYMKGGTLLYEANASFPLRPFAKKK